MSGSWCIEDGPVQVVDHSEQTRVLDVADGTERAGYPRSVPWEDADRAAPAQPLPD